MAPPDFWNSNPERRAMAGLPPRFRSVCVPGISGAAPASTGVKPGRRWRISIFHVPSDFSDPISPAVCSCAAGYAPLRLQRCNQLPAYLFQPPPVSFPLLLEQARDLGRGFEVHFCMLLRLEVYQLLKQSDKLLRSHRLIIVRQASLRLQCSDFGSMSHASALRFKFPGGIQKTVLLRGSGRVKLS